MAKGDSKGPLHVAAIKRGVALTAELKKLASQVHTIRDDGTQITREEALAEHIWNLALGWIERTRDENGTLQEIKHPPVAWAAQYLFERCEGKAQVASLPVETGLRASEKVRALARERLNAFVKVPAVGPPSHKPKGSP